jgi:hypothetical protein
VGITSQNQAETNAKDLKKQFAETFGDQKWNA